VLDDDDLKCLKTYIMPTPNECKEEALKHQSEPSSTDPDVAEAGSRYTDRYVWFGDCPVIGAQFLY
jgi:hypothetical protein